MLVACMRVRASQGTLCRIGLGCDAFGGLGSGSLAGIWAGVGSVNHSQCLGGQEPARLLALMLVA